MTCPECGHQNNQGDRFCSNCGASLANVTPPPEEPATPAPPASKSTEPTPSPTSSPMPPPVSFAPPQVAPSVDEEWRMSSLGPPAGRKRSIWLWILIGIIALCLLSCVAFIGFSMTDTGREWIEGVATEAAEQATNQAE